MRSTGLTLIIVLVGAGLLSILQQLYWPSPEIGTVRFQNGIYFIRPYYEYGWILPCMSFLLILIGRQMHATPLTAITLSAVPLPLFLCLAAVFSRWQVAFGIAIYGLGIGLLPLMAASMAIIITSMRTKHRSLEWKNLHYFAAFGVVGATALHIAISRLTASLP